MRITIECSPRCPHVKNSIELTGDIVSDNIEDIADLFRGLLVAYGFHPNTVREYLDPEYNLEEKHEDNNF